MTTTVNLRALLHRKKWEPCTPARAANGAGMFIVAADLGTQMARMFEVQSAALIYSYYGAEDGWVQLPASGLGGTFGAGACGEFHPDGPSGTATAGTTTTFTTNLTILRDLRGHKVRITGGPNAGQDFEIASNTIGANSIVTITTTAGTAFTAASTYVLRSGRLWVFIPSATAPALGYYDWALNAWTARAVTGLPTAWVTEGQLVGVDSFRSGALISGTATAGAATTLTDVGKAWTVNALANLQVRITGGTGAGQVRVITSNTATALTVAAWGTNPDVTSTYAIEGDDNALYLMGNAAVTLYKYSISGNTWTTVTPAVARGAATGAGMTADWVFDVTDAAWNLPAAPLNGRYIYSFRGAAGAVLDVFDLATLSWSVRAYGNQAETFTTGTNSCYNGDGRIYIQKDAGTLFFYFDLVINALRPLSTLIYGVGAATAGDKMAVIEYFDGATKVEFLYLRRSTGTELFRMLII